MASKDSHTIRVTFQCPICSMEITREYTLARYGGLNDHLHYCVGCSAPLRLRVPVIPANVVGYREFDGDGNLIRSGRDENNGISRYQMTGDDDE